MREGCEECDVAGTFLSLWRSLVPKHMITITSYSIAYPISGKALSVDAKHLKFVDIETETTIIIYYIENNKTHIFKMQRAGKKQDPMYIYIYM